MNFFIKKNRFFFIIFLNFLFFTKLLKTNFFSKFFWTPKDDIRKIIIDEINSTKKAIRAAYFIFSDKLIGEALINAYKRGVKITLILDKSSFVYQIPHILEKAGIDILYYKGKNCINMHNKFFIFENFNRERKIILGSYNCTNNASINNREFIIFTNFLEIISEVEICFKYLKNEIDDFDKKSVD